MSYFDGFRGIVDGILLEQNRGLNEAKIAFQSSFGPPFSRGDHQVPHAGVVPLRARRVSGGVSEVDGKTGHAVDLLRAWVMANKEAPAHLELKVARSGGSNPELGSQGDFVLTV